jgi:hypothetical protein
MFSSFVADQIITLQKNKKDCKNLISLTTNFKKVMFLIKTFIPEFTNANQPEPGKLY